MKLSVLIGSGRKIGALILPFLVAGIILNILYPAVFSVGGPSPLLSAISAVILIIGLIVWIWSVVLIVTRIPGKKLITTGPYSIVRHPLYTGVGLLVFPWIGILCNTWLGIVIGVIMYIGSRIYSPEEEEILAKFFGSEWEDYCNKVLLPWL